MTRARHVLSRRQREVLLWACRGKTYAEIASIVGLSWGTAKSHLDQARLKLNAANMPQACAIALAEGVFSREDIMGAMDRQEADRAAASDPASTPQPPQNRP
jgi:DNA-binding CsgD family transcriptional regulator